MPDAAKTRLAGGSQTCLYLQVPSLGRVEERVSLQHHPLPQSGCKHKRKGEADDYVSAVKMSPHLIALAVL